jgi:hypothetical protein
MHAIGFEPIPFHSPPLSTSFFQVLLACHRELINPNMLEVLSQARVETSLFYLLIVSITGIVGGI